MKHRLLCILSAIVLGIVALASTRAYAPVDKKKSADGRVHLLHTDRLYFDKRKNPRAKFLVGNVQFEHDGAIMYCDSALLYEATPSMGGGAAGSSFDEFNAFGHVRMVQGDTLTLVCDEMYYDCRSEIASARYNVVLTHRDTRLYSDSLDYERLINTGYYSDGGRLIDKDNELTSDWGVYQVDTRDAHFQYNVILLNPAPPKETRTKIITNDLYYNTGTELAYVVGPSNIDNGGNHIYTERGYYDSQKDFVTLLDRTILQNGHKTLVGDSVVWDNVLKKGQAFGNAIYHDEENKNYFKGDYCLYNDSTGYSIAYDNALAIDYSQGDTLWAHADTFKVFSYNYQTDSVYRVLHAYKHMRAYRSDVQAVCDSMVMNSKDSCMILYRDPIMWMEDQQLLGEEIHAFFNDSTIDSVQVHRQALSVERLDSIHYNQIAGKLMRFYFIDSALDRSVVEGNVYLNYYPIDDDSLMIGMNHIESTLMKMYLKESKVDHVWMPAATGTLYPVPLIPHNVLYLENFAWFDYIRPLNKDDVFEWRGKTQGLELKESIRREAPKQKLKDIKQ